MPGTDAPVLVEAVADFVHEWPASRVVFGPGRVDSVADEVRRLGSRAMVISSPAARAPAQRVVDDLDDAVRARISEVVQHVPVAAVGAAVTRAREVEADVLVCVGGGSATGLAKGVARELGLPIVAVPTTYAGSEMTSIWGLTEGGRKTTGRAPAIRPRAVVYDPEITVDLPVPMTVTSGVNATAHCVEALYAPGTSPLTLLAAAEGIRSMAIALPKLIEDRRDVDVRGLALRAAWLSGWVLEVSSTGLHHKLCHVLGGLLDLPHSPLHTVVLPYAVAHTAPAAPAAMTTLLDSLGVDGSPEDAGGLLWDHHHTLGAPTSLAAIGMREEHLDRGVEAAALALAATSLTPRDADRGDLRHLITTAWKGTRPGRA
jgi:maleylacetate reductase